nr:odorant receptor 13a-like [Nomia melanderi]
MMTAGERHVRRPDSTVNKARLLFYEKKYGEFVQALPPAITGIVALIKYGNVIGKMEKVKRILLMIKRDKEQYVDLPESRVLTKYDAEGRLIVQIFAGKSIVLSCSEEYSEGYFTLAILVFLALPLPEIIRDARNLANITEPRLLHPMEYNVDHSKYYYQITVHAYAGSALTVFVIIALDSFFIVAIQHCCLLFAITGFQLKTAHVLNQSTLWHDDQWKVVDVEKFTTREQSLVYRKVERAVAGHMSALEYVNLVQSTFSSALLIQVFLTLVCMTVTAVQILRNINNYDIVLGMMFWLVGQVIHLFFLCFNGQRLSDYSQNVYYDAMECVWYTFCAKSKVVYQFFVMNTIAPHRLVAMKLMVLDMQTFQAVMRLSASYLTMLLSAV